MSWGTGPGPATRLPGTQRFAKTLGQTPVAQQFGAQVKTKSIVTGFTVAVLAFPPCDLCVNACSPTHLHAGLEAPHVHVQVDPGPEEANLLFLHSPAITGSRATGMALIRSVPSRLEPAGKQFFAARFARLPRSDEDSRRAEVVSARLRASRCLAGRAFGGGSPRHGRESHRIGQREGRAIGDDSHRP